METRAPFVLIGAFVLAAIAAVFGFVYWLNNTGGLGPRATYHVQFEGSVPGLMVGAAVLFNGIRVGEVTDLGLAADNARRVNATISVASSTPVRADTKIGLEFQGLTGVPVIALEGGTMPAGSAPIPTLIAEQGAGQSMTQAARDALRRVDAVLAENAGPLKDTIANLKVFSEGLARNTGKLDGIVSGLEKMTGGGAPAQKITYDLRAPPDLGWARVPVRDRSARGGRGLGDAGRLRREPDRDRAGWGGAAAAALPSASITPTTVFTCTVAPSLTLISFRMPAAGAGISASTLSVEISNSGSSRWTLSPGFFSHLVMVPSKIDSPIWGITTSVAMSSFHRCVSAG